MDLNDGTTSLQWTIIIKKWEKAEPLQDAILVLKRIRIDIVCKDVRKIITDVAGEFTTFWAVHKYSKFKFRPSYYLWRPFPTDDKK